MEVEIPESSSYEFLIQDTVVGEADGVELQQVGTHEITLADSDKPTPTPTPAPTPTTVPTAAPTIEPMSSTTLTPTTAPTSDSTIEPMQEPEDRTEYAQIDIFILASFMIEDDDTCRPNTEETPVIRIVASDGSSWTRHFRHAESKEADNTYVPGERGCLSTGTIPYQSSETYRIQLNDETIVDVEGTYFDDGTELVVIIDESGPVMDPQLGLSIPTPVPTVAPTPTPQPAGHIEGDQYLLRGYFTLQSDNVVATGDICFGTGGYSDIGSGTQVVIRDGNNNVLGIGELEYSEDMTRGTGCTFMFEIEVPETAFYQIEMSHRGQMIYSFDDLEEDLWTVFLVLGR